jgi:hypothetical protein
MATANGTTGTYLVTASVAGTGEAGIALTNTEAASLVLTTTRDVVDPFDGLTSLREAIAYANSHPGPDTIIFNPAALGRRPVTIRLTGGPLVLTDPATTTIVGPGAKRLTIGGAGRSRVFDVQGGSLAISGLTIADGRADHGAGIRNEGGQLALTRVVLGDNRARLLGGGLHNDDTATLRGVTVTENAASIGGGIADLSQQSASKVTIHRNVALAGRGLFNRGKLMRIPRRTPAGARVVPAGHLSARRGSV